MKNMNFEQFLELAPDAIIVSNKEGIILFINGQTETVFHYKRSELIGQSIDVFLPNDLKEKHAHLRSSYIKHPVTRLMSSNANLLARRKDGKIIPVEISLSPYHTSEGLIVIAIVRDVTYRKELEQNLQYAVDHDFLTGLLNRHIFEIIATKAIELAKRYNHQVAILFMDLDGFKAVNDCYGHHIGDLLLKKLSKLFMQHIRKSDTVARIGGDEFALLLPEIKNKDEIIMVADKVLSIFNTEVKIKKYVCHITISIGIAVYPEDAHDYDTLLKKADEAMYLIKKKGKNHYRFAAKDGE